MTTDNLLFAEIKVLPPFDKQKVTNEILSLSNDLSFWDEYRNTRMFPLMTKFGDKTRTGTEFRGEGEFQWTDYAPQELVDWFENHVFPWIGTKSRVMVLITQPGTENHEHIDSAPWELNTRQHKFRVVLQGRTDTLYWLTNKGRVHVPEIENPFIMAGDWPHGMSNNTDQVKVTITLGAPWNGKEDYGSDLKLLQVRSDYVMPENTSDYFNKKHYRV